MREVEKRLDFGDHGQATIAISGAKPAGKWAFFYAGSSACTGLATTGLTADDLRKVADELDKLNRKPPTAPHIFKFDGHHPATTLECLECGGSFNRKDLLPDGCPLCKGDK